MLSESEYYNFKKLFLKEDLNEGVITDFAKKKIAPIAVAGALSANAVNAQTGQNFTDSINKRSGWVKELIQIANLPRDEYRDMVIAINDALDQDEDITLPNIQKKAIDSLRTKFKERGDRENLSKLNILVKNYY